MKAIIEIIKKEEYLTLTPENRREKDLLIKLWEQLPDIKFEKRGSVTGLISIREHKFTIKIIEPSRI